MMKEISDLVVALSKKVMFMKIINLQRRNLNSRLDHF